MATLFFSYSHADEALRDQLEVQLAMLKRQGVIEPWHDRRIIAGETLDHSISAHVENDDIILLLVSPDFIASDYCYDKEMMRAMERQDAGTATVIPVILRYCEWHHAPFGKLLATPTDGKPVTSWSDRDHAFLAVAQAIRKAAEKVNGTGSSRQTSSLSKGDPTTPVSAFPALPPRSSNLRLAKQFNERDMDRFRIDTFEFLASFFENSLAELGVRHEGIEGVFRRIDTNRFTAVIYKAGKSVARCTIFMGGSFSRTSINYVAQETTDSNSYNESLSVSADDQAMYLKSMGMSYSVRQDGKLSQEGAAEFYWSLLIDPLQRNR